MTTILFDIIKICIYLIAFELSSFIVGIFFAMNDGPRPNCTNVIYFIIKYICGFPLVMINNQYPFFLDSGRAISSNRIILLWGANILCQIIIIYIIKKFIFWIFGFSDSR